MPSTSAVVFTAPGEVRLQPIVMPPPRHEEVQIRTEWSVVSAGTEGWALQDRFTWAATTFPCVPGYQRVGTIVEIGPGIEGFQVGERVMAMRGVWDAADCEGISAFWGSHIGLANSPIEDVFRLPDGCDALEAAGAVVAQVGYNAAYRAQLAAGDWILVLGDGLIGMCAAQAARSRGCKVLLAGHRRERMKLARRWCADEVVDSRADDFVGQVQRVVGAPHVAAILDSVQSTSMQPRYLPLLENERGQIVYCGFTPGTCWADMALLQQRELTTHFIAGWNRARMEATLTLLSEKQMQIRPLLTHIVEPEHATKMYRMIAEKSEAFGGIAFDWRNS